MIGVRRGGEEEAVILKGMLETFHTNSICNPLQRDSKHQESRAFPELNDVIGNREQWCTSGMSVKQAKRGWNCLSYHPPPTPAVPSSKIFGHP